MTLVFNGHSYKYEIESVVKLFIPATSFNFNYNGEVPSGDYILTELSRWEGITTLATEVKIGDTTEKGDAFTDNSDENYINECERKLSVLVFNAMAAITGIRPKWGILTGVRPVSLLRRFSKGGMSDMEVDEFMTEKMLVTKEKLQIARGIEILQRSMLDLLEDRSFSLYVSIPFCPSRCSYCSFISQAGTKELIPPYIDKLCEEIDETARIAKEYGLRLETIYFGGGTPTVLEDSELARLMDRIERGFDLSTLREYTIEAGRPDTITREKLKAMKRAGVTRISINPQTMNDDVLSHIGREHSSSDVVDAFNLARRVGMDNINMDLIAGLPKDTVSGFKHTIDEVLALSPESITMHTLSLKRSSRLYEDRSAIDKGIDTERMVEYAMRTLTQSQFVPYYLYRQKNILQNLENVGYAKQGKEGLYNVFIMEEVHNILAVGASAVSKIIIPSTGEIRRNFNFKLPYEYIRRFDDVIARKQEIRDLFGKF